MAAFTGRVSDARRAPGTEETRHMRTREVLPVVRGDRRVPPDQRGSIVELAPARIPSEQEFYDALARVPMVERVD